MRRCPLSVCMLTLLAMCLQSSAAWADDAQARAVIDKAIKAHGGAANLAKFKAMSVKIDGKIALENRHLDAKTLMTCQMPDKIRLDHDISVNNNTFAFHRVVTGNKGWQGTAKGVRDMRDAQVAQIADELYAHWLASVAPLADKAFQLESAGETTVDNKPAIGVRVSRKDRPDVNLYFDKKSGLLLKTERRTKNLMNQEYTAESIFRDYKEVNGVQWPTRRLDKRDGMELEDGAGIFELSDYQALDPVEEKLFTKP